MLHVECSGSPYEIGHEHGAQAASHVKGSLTFYEKMFWDKSQLQWPAVCTEAEKWLPYLEESWPEYVEEMRGLAAGSGCAFTSILALNVRTEIAFGLSFPTSSQTVDGCTTLAYHSASKLGARDTAILAQNWDWEVEQMSNLVHLTIRHPSTSNKAPILSFVTEGGIIGKIGLNGYGIGTCLNAVRAPGVSHTRLPVHLALRATLDCDVAKLQKFRQSNGHNTEVNGGRPDNAAHGSSDHPKPSAETAAEILFRAGVASAAHILVADSESGIGLETSCKETHRVPVEQLEGAEVVLHTNHFVVPSHSVLDVKDWFGNSSARLIRIEELIKAKQGIGLADVEEFLKDEEGYPSGICRDVNPQAGITATTVFSIAMDLNERRARVKIGRPIKPSEIFELDAKA